MYMAKHPPLMTESERALAETVARLAHENPFLPGRIALERSALGDAFIESTPNSICALYEEFRISKRCVYYLSQRDS